MRFTVTFLLLYLALFSCSKIETPGPVIFRFAGDVMFDRGIKRTLKKGVHPFYHISDLSRSAHIMMINLETTIATNGEKVPKAFNFMSHPDSLAFVTNAGIDLVSIANNHTMDYGTPAIIQTIHNLNKYGLRHAGAGMDLPEASQGVILETNGIKIGFLAFGDIYPLSLYASDTRPGIAGIQLEQTSAVIKAFKPQVDFLIVSLHWGWEYEDLPKSYQTVQAYEFIDSGADLIIGHHPHVLQGVEKYKNGVIFYSMGNFVFDQKKELKTRYTMIGELELVKKLDAEANTNLSAHYSFHPFIKDYTDYMPRIMDEKEHAAWMDHFSEISKKLGPVSFSPRTNSDTSHYDINWTVDISDKLTKTP